jgi:hypothetical protein
VHSVSAIGRLLSKVPVGKLFSRTLPMESIASANDRSTPDRTSATGAVSQMPPQGLSLSSACRSQSWWRINALLYVSRPSVS